MPLRVVLVTPEIPQNTGNIARTCAAVGAELHLVHPLGFSISERAVRRAGLDYWDLVKVREHSNVESCLQEFDLDSLHLFTSKTARSIADTSFSQDAALVFGSETSGLSHEVLARFSDRTVRIPTLSEARCLNLSNAVAVAVYEALRQNKYRGLQLSRATVMPSAASKAEEGT
jgi:tRNA (cytidine/uridine-2'-O-)-methyltransferase